MKISTTQAYTSLLKNIQTHFQNSSNYLHKARNEIKIIKHENQEYAVKSFKVPHLLNKVVYSFFRSSKAQKSYDNSVKISDFVPRPIGYVEFTKFGLIHNSYFVSESFSYDFTIREPLLDENFEERERVFKEFAYFTGQLHKNDIYHLDYSPGNILIKKENGQFIFKIVDINRMEFKVLDLETRLKNFAKLWAKDEDLEVIVREYAMLVKEDEEKCIKKALLFSQQHKDKKNFKKRLKGEAVVD
ncbi:MAG TPA: hypothetical protein EYG94_09720 [Campylobacterales bacterium]|nr:hypothetical protein [Campylobacterales bacterium]